MRCTSAKARRIKSPGANGAVCAPQSSKWWLEWFGLFVELRIGTGRAGPHCLRAGAHGVRPTSSRAIQNNTTTAVQVFRDPFAGIPAHGGKPKF